MSLCKGGRGRFGGRREANCFLVDKPPEKFNAKAACRGGAIENRYLYFSGSPLC
jgi:hypothetical protein